MEEEEWVTSAYLRMGRNWGVSLRRRTYLGRGCGNPDFVRKETKEEIGKGREHCIKKVK